MKEELSAQADQVVGIISDMRSKLAANMMSNEQVDGCLLGAVNDYLKVFDE